MKCIIFFNQGWTDIIQCIGLVFYNQKIYDEIHLLIREDAADMINFLFRNIDNIIFHFLNKSKIMDSHGALREYINHLSESKGWMDIKIYTDMSLPIQY